MYYYVGQKVSHQAFGDGEVIQIHEGNIFPVRVKFLNAERIFTENGKYQMSEFPSLSQKPHVPLELKEIVTFEKGELVWVKDNCNETWEARFYSHQQGEVYCCFANQSKCGSTINWNEIRKFSDIPF